MDEENKRNYAVKKAALKSVKGTVHGKSVKDIEQPTTGTVLDFTNDENAALEWYVSGEGQWINQYMRGRWGSIEDLNDNEKELLQLLTSATERTLSDDIEVLYRSVDASAIFGDNVDFDNLYSFLRYGDSAYDKGAYSQGLKQKAQTVLDKTKGKTITEKGFMSTTKEYDVAAEWGDFTGADMPVVLDLDVPKGIKGADLKNFDIEGNEQFEVLLARNTEYEIGEISAKDGNIYIKAKLKAKKGNS